MSEDPYLVELSDGIKTITLNQPERRNPISPALALELSGQVKKSGHDGTRVLLMTGAGGAFSAGADLEAAPDPEDPGKMVDRSYNELVRAVTNLERPVIAAVDGVAAGFGLSLAVACDMLFASDRAKFSMVFINIALSPDGGASWTIPRLIGRQKAMELACTAEVFDVQKADKLGLINRIYPSEDLMKETLNFAKKLAEGPVKVMGIAKRLFYDSESMDLDAALTKEAKVQGFNLQHPDFFEGVAAFMEKRKPKFS
ncbi:enoyl-CoA hydratase-related protein [Thermodesulfobacteriota bacterium]